jgi:hypothetical protein
VLPPRKKENRKKNLRSSVKAVSTSSLMPSSHAAKGKADREEEDTCNQSLLLGEEPNLSHHHTWTRLCLSRHCSSFCINIITLLEKLQTHDQYKDSRALLLHHNSIEVLSFWLPIWCSLVLCKIATS